MARGVNKVILLGNLGKEPELRTTSSGNSMAKITLATSESWKDKNTGEPVERTEWHNITFFGRLAEIVGQYLHKGAKIYVEGRIQTRKWQDQEGKDRYTTDIIANDMQMLGGRGESGGYQAPPANQSYQQAKPQQSTPSTAPEAPLPDFDDDIPF